MRSPWLLLPFLALACSSSSSSTTPDATDGGGGTTTPVVTGTGDSKILAGTFQATLVAPVAGAAGTTSVIGKVYDGATLAEVIDETSLTANGCVLSTPRVPFCNTPCGGTSACVENDTCKAYPVAHSVGAVTVTGVKTAAGEATFMMSPVVNAYQPTAALAYPAFAEGDVISFTAAGDYYAGFTLQTKGVAALVTDTAALVLTRDTAATLTWKAPADASASTMSVKLDISHHGGSKGKIACDVPDNGSLTIPANMVSKLLDLGVAGFPTVQLTRTALATAVIASGRVELRVTSQVERAVSVTGVTSCTDSSTCPTGMTCQSDLTCK